MTTVDIKFGDDTLRGVMTLKVPRANDTSQYYDFIYNTNDSLTITDTASHDVKQYATAQISDANLSAGNIKSGVSILGITGSFDYVNANTQSF